MILIADSGSTKTDWRLIDKNQNISQYKTKGFNPYLQTEIEITTILKEELCTELKSDIIEKIFFYGAGCSSKKLCDVIHGALQKIFENANIEVEHDLLAAARALFHYEDGIAAILGTGSNSCVYDGKEIIEHIPSTGYILGDEGSGCDMGKRLIKAVVTKDIPKDLHKKFVSQYHADYTLILENVYKKPFPNRYLASFSHFISHNISHPYISELVFKSFNSFFDNYICRYSDYKNKKMRCVGSIGFYLSNILRNAANNNSVALDRIIESPIAGLTLYHITKAY